MTSYKFIVNPTASSGKCARIADQLEKICQSLKMDFDMDFTQKPGDAIDLAQSAREKFECVVAVGGDGTINEVVNGLMGGKAKLGVIPAGTGNDFIKAVSIPLKLDHAIGNLIGMNTQKIDIGIAGDRYFCNGLGIGFDAWVVQESLNVKKLRGKAIYLYSVLKTINSYQPPLIRLTYNKVVREEKLYMVTVGNGISLGGGFKLTPNAIIDDGLFDLTIIRNLKYWEIYKNLISVFPGKHIYLEQVTTDRTDCLKIESEEGFASHMDGELLSLNIQALDIRILPGALEVVVSE